MFKCRMHAVALAAAGLAVAAATSAVMPAVAHIDGRIRVDVAGGTGPAVTGWGFDIKQPGKALGLADNRSLANRIFGDESHGGLGMSVLRIPIYATSDVHPRAGLVKGDVTGKSYGTVVKAVANAEAADEHRHVRVFASLRLQKGTSFAAWTKPSDDGYEGVNPERYAQLLLDYLSWMTRHGVQPDVLGVDNESRFNEGRITPEKYTAIVRRLREKIATHNRNIAAPAQKVRVPQFIAPDSYRPQGWFLDRLTGSRAWGTVDMVGVHYYNTMRVRDAGYLASWNEFAGKARRHGRALWDSELHWDRVDKPGSADTPWETYRVLVSGMVGAADHFDQGFTGMTWWDLAADGSYRAQVQGELVRSTAGARPYVHVEDGDGPSAGTGRLTTRALRQGDDVVVWVVNDTARADRSKWIQLAGAPKVSRPRFDRWQYENGQLRHTQGTGSVVSADAVSVPVPPHSIQAVRIPHVR